MAKVKKITVAIVTTIALLTSAFGITASANTLMNSSAQAAFYWGRGYAQMTNKSTTQRYCMVYVNVYTTTTGEYITQGTNEGPRGLDGSVYVTLNGYSDYNYYFVCNGSIRCANVVQSPEDWRITKYI